MLGRLAFRLDGPGTHVPESWSFSIRFLCGWERGERELCAKRKQLEREREGGTWLVFCAHLTREITGRRFYPLLR